MQFLLKSHVFKVRSSELVILHIACKSKVGSQSKPEIKSYLSLAEADV